MKSTKFLSDIRGKSAVELRKLAAELNEKLRMTRLDIMTGKSKNGAAVKKLKREIARILTVTREAN